MPTRIGKYTVRMDSRVSVASYGAVGSKKEAEGPLADSFDMICDDGTFGEQTWEKAESRLQKDAVNAALSKGGFAPSTCDYIFAGDLLNQCTGSSYGIRDLGIPFFGLYGACSTMAEGLALASLFVETSIATRCIAVTSSHFCSAEKQFRFPLEYAGQRTPTSQWTVTGAGGAIVEQGEKPPFVKAVTIGTIEDLGIKDVNNMGAAMAPAAAMTLKRFFEDTLTTVNDYDLIATGDLGRVGTDLLRQLLTQDGIDLGKRHTDCGLLIYDLDSQNVGAGGSGCGCSASVLCGHLLPKLRSGELKNMLFIATGALMSTVSVQQGESIPGIAHLIHLSNQ